ncbi:hypothetical protein J6590_031888 [Homalodisca vitripennis]|nr:hypothetical protein J6590_031888 [Homalodisca vitripennis]
MELLLKLDRADPTVLPRNEKNEMNWQGLEPDERARRPQTVHVSSFFLLPAPLNRMREKTEPDCTQLRRAPYSHCRRLTGLSGQHRY